MGAVVFVFAVAIVGFVILMNKDNTEAVTPPNHDKLAAQNKEAKTAILTGLEEGKLFNFILDDGAGNDVGLPFRLMKSERLIYACPAAYGKTGREYQAGSTGASLRVAKGVTLRTGGSRGRSVDTPIKFDDRGMLGITNKHVYFASDDALHGKSFRVRFDKLVSSRGLGHIFTFMRDLASAKPEGFANVDGAFVNELVATLSTNLADGTKFDDATQEDVDRWLEAATSQDALYA